MDIQYLLMLQQLRMSAGSIFTPLMLLISDLAATGSAAACIVIFWGIDRSLGYWLISNTLSGIFFNNALKLTACVYRPWIRCPDLIPPAKALESATGYSFPSGHTQVVSSFYGSCIYSARNKHKGIAVFSVIMILLTGFSRNYLGVHTPQDVLVAMASSAALIAVNVFLMKKIREDQTLVFKLIAAGCVTAVLCIVYFTFKSYPIDYLDGTLVVDPSVMRDDGYAAAGAALGALIGAYIEIRYIRFSAEGTPVEKILRLLFGVPGIALIMLAARKPVYSLAGPDAGHVIIYCLLAMYITAGYPAVFSAVHRRHRERNEGKE